MEGHRRSTFSGKGSHPTAVKAAKVDPSHLPIPSAAPLSPRCGMADQQRGLTLMSRHSASSLGDLLRRFSDGTLPAAVRKRFSKDDSDRKPSLLKWANAPLNGSNSSQFSISQHEIGMESMVSPKRTRRGAISSTVLPSLDDDSGPPSTPRLMVSVEEIKVTVYRNGQLLTSALVLPRDILTGELLRPVLSRVDSSSQLLDQCSCQLLSPAPPSGGGVQEVDLHAPASQYSGGHISVSIVNSPSSPASTNKHSSRSPSPDEVRAVFTDVQQCLRHFDQHGIQPLSPGAPELPCQPPLPELPSSWRDAVAPEVVDRVCSEGGRSEDLQQYIWELVQTEHSHIRQLQVVVDLFMRSLEYIMNVDILSDVIYHNIFGRMREILGVHRSLWETVLAPCWAGPALCRQPFDAEELLGRFPEFRTQFEVYEQHCIFESQNLRELRQAVANPSFKAYLDWCEAKPECQRLKLTDYLAKPMQRLTKYPLLLKQVLRALEDPQQRGRMEGILRSVEEYVAVVNTALQSQQEVDTVMNVMDQLDHYSAVTAQGEMERMLNPYCRVDLLAPMPGADLRCSRMLLHHATLRCREGAEGRERGCLVLVFTDLVLLARRFKRNQEHKLDVIKPPQRIDRIVLRPKDSVTFLVVYLNDFNVATAAFSLKADSPRQAKEFESQFDRAQTYYEKLVTEKASNVRQRLLVSPGNSTPDGMDRTRAVSHVSCDQLASPLLSHQLSQLSVLSSPPVSSHLAGTLLSETEDGGEPFLPATDHSPSGSRLLLGQGSNGSRVSMETYGNGSAVQGSNSPNHTLQHLEANSTGNEEHLEVNSTGSKEHLQANSTGNVECLEVNSTGSKEHLQANSTGNVECLDSEVNSTGSKERLEVNWTGNEEHLDVNSTGSKEHLQANSTGNEERLEVNSTEHLEVNWTGNEESVKVDPQKIVMDGETVVPTSQCASSFLNSYSSSVSMTIGATQTPPPPVPIHRVDTVNSSTQTATIKFAESPYSSVHSLTQTESTEVDEIHYCKSNFVDSSYSVSIATTEDECLPPLSRGSVASKGSASSGGHGNQLTGNADDRFGTGTGSDDDLSRSTVARRNHPPLGPRPYSLSNITYNIFVVPSEDKESSLQDIGSLSLGRGSPSLSRRTPSLSKVSKERKHPFWKGSPPLPRRSRNDVRISNEVERNPHVLKAEEISNRKEISDDTGGSTNDVAVPNENHHRKQRRAKSLFSWSPKLPALFSRSARRSTSEGVDHSPSPPPVVDKRRTHSVATADPHGNGRKCVVHEATWV